MNTLSREEVEKYGKTAFLMLVREYAKTTKFFAIIRKYYVSTLRQFDECLVAAFTHKLHNTAYTHYLTKYSIHSKEGSLKKQLHTHLARQGDVPHLEIDEIDLHSIALLAFMCQKTCERTRHPLEEEEQFVFRVMIEGDCNEKHARDFVRFTADKTYQWIKSIQQ